jgi:hypothetical protein
VGVAVSEPKRFIGGSEKWLFHAPWPLVELVVDNEGVAVRGVIWPLRWLVPSARFALGDIAYVEVEAVGRLSNFTFRTKAPSLSSGVIFLTSPSQRQAIIESLASAGLDVRGRDGKKLDP